MDNRSHRFCKQFKRIITYILVFMGIFFTLFMFSSAKNDPEIRNKVQTVVIDAGHGGKDPGALGSFAKEKDISLGVALKLGAYIEENFKDVKVLYTRDKDVFIPLFDRADLANKSDADLFISIHANSSEKKSVYGSETYVMGEHKNESNFEVAKTENNVITLEEDYTTKYEGFDPNSIESYIIFSLMQRTFLNQSLNFAGKVQYQFREKARRADRGVVQAGFLVLWRTSMPSVLIELGFISNPEEEKYLSSLSGQEYLASAIYRAFREYKDEIEKSSNFETRATRDNDLDKSVQTYFKIQVFSSRTLLDPADPSLNGLTGVESFKAGKWYKYASGQFESYEEAQLKLTTIRERFPDAFVIAIHNGSIIPINEARQIIKKLQP